MNREQVKELFKLINFTYPNFEVSSEKLDTWTRLMRHQDYEKVMKKAEKHIVTERFPPTIAHLSEAPREEYNNDIFKKIEEWERNAQPRSRE